MPAKKDKTEDKILIKQFKDGSSFWWVDNKVYHLNENNEVVFICGGLETDKDREAIELFILRNKKKHKEREKSILEQEEIEYTKITFGKYSGESTQSLVLTDKRYSNWLYTNTTDNKIKSELKALLKK